MAESEKKSYNIKSNARYIVDLLTLTGKLPVSERETIPEINNNAQLLAWASTKKYFEIWRNPRYVRPGDILLFGANTTGISFKFSDGLIFESVEGEIVKERHIRNVSHLLRLVDVIVEEEIFPTPIEFLPEIIPTPQDAPPREQEQISAPVEWCRRILANVSVHFSGRWNGDPEIDQHYLWDEQFDSRMIGGIYGGIKEVHRCEQFLVFNAVLPNRLVEYVQGLEVAKHSLVINIIAKVENGSSFLSVNFGSTIGAPIPQIVEDELLQDDINSTVVVEVSEIDPVVNELPKAECHVEIDEYGKIINNLFPTTLNRVFTDPGTDSTWSLEIEIDDEEGITFLCESDCDGWIPPDYGPYTECDCAPTININVPISGQEILISYIKQLIRNTNESIGTKCNPQHILEFVLSIEGIKYDDSEKIFLVPGQYYTYIVNTGEINGICLGRIYVDPIPPDPDPDPEVQDCTCPTIDLCIDPAGQKYEWDELKTLFNRIY